MTPLDPHAAFYLALGLLLLLWLQAWHMRYREDADRRAERGEE